MMTHITQDMLDDVRHALGLTGGRTEAYRNYYAANPEDENMAAMVKLGLFEKGPQTSWGKGLVYHHVTEAGMKAAGLDPETVNAQLEARR